MGNFGSITEKADGDWIFHVGDQELTETARGILTHELPLALALFLEKNRGYGDMADTLGSRAQFVDMHRKMDKLKRALWEGQDIGREAPREVVLDLFGHCLLMLRQMNIEDRAKGPF